jgi:hypothetical protein
VRDGSTEEFGERGCTEMKIQVKKVEKVEATTQGTGPAA